jgi:hypothetical protein
VRGGERTFAYVLMFNPFKNILMVWPTVLLIKVLKHRWPQKKIITIKLLLFVMFPSSLQFWDFHSCGVGAGICPVWTHPYRRPLLCSIFQSFTNKIKKKNPSHPTTGSSWSKCTNFGVCGILKISISLRACEIFTRYLALCNCSVY